MKEIISSLDIGSSTVKVVVGEMYKDELNVLSASEVKSKGIKRGIIVNPEEALISIKEAFNRTEDMLGIKVNKVILTVPSYYAEFLVVDGEIEVKNENGIVGSKEVISVLQSCVYNKVPNNKEFVAITPIEFKLDNEKKTITIKSIPSQSFQRKLRCRTGNAMSEVAVLTLR